MSRRNDIPGYIYIVFVNQRFKIGRCTDITQRMRGYPQGTFVLQVAHVSNMAKAERALIEFCQANLHLQPAGGREYFIGNQCELLNGFQDIARQFMQPLTTGTTTGCRSGEQHHTVDRTSCIDRNGMKLQNVITAFKLDPLRYKVSQDILGHKLDFSVRVDDRWEHIPGCRSFPDLRRYLSAPANGTC